MQGKIIGKAEDHTVYINDRQILVKDSLKIINHSPDGFSWGYGGSGPSQLALAILLKFVNVDVALKLYQDFKWKFLVNLDTFSDFEISCEQIEEYIKDNED